MAWPHQIAGQEGKRTNDALPPTDQQSRLAHSEIGFNSLELSKSEIPCGRNVGADEWSVAFHGG